MDQAHSGGPDKYLLNQNSPSPSKLFEPLLQLLQLPWPAQEREFSRLPLSEAQPTHPMENRHPQTSSGWEVEQQPGGVLLVEVSEAEQHPDTSPRVQVLSILQAQQSADAQP